MGRVFKIIAILIGVVILLFILLIGGIYLNGQRVLNSTFSNPVQNVTVQASAEKLARGQYMVAVIPGCAGCHSSNPAAAAPQLDGTVMELGPLGIFPAPNLTPGGPLKNWSDGEIIRAIREGIDKDGKPLLVMPSAGFKNISDDDVQAIVAYLRQMQPSDKDLGPKKPGFLGIMLLGAGQITTSAQQPVSNVKAPPVGATLEWGKYVMSYAPCGDCHGPNLDGKNVPPGPPPGPDLSVVARWTQEQFMQTLKTGTTPDGQKLDPELMPFQEFGKATDTDLQAMYLYLKDHFK